MTDKLKNCPFCGGQAHFVNAKGNWISCIECGAESDFFDDKRQAIKAWNTRKPMEAIIQQLVDVSYEPENFEYEDFKVVDLEEAIAVVKGVQNE